VCIASEVYMHCELLGLCSVVCICSSCVIYLFFSCLTSQVKMVRPLSQGKQQNVLSLLQKGCSVREIAKSLHVGKSSVQRLRKKHFPDAKLSVGGRPRKLTSAMERSCVTSVTRGKVSTAKEATKQVQEVFGV
jgi:IS30 family transposase